jgi:hypothetical protein
MMVRTQVSLDAEVHRRAKDRAAELGLSLAEYVRRLVDDDLEETSPPPKADISEIFGMFDSGSSDIARFKDQYLGEAVDALHPRRPALAEGDRGRGAVS